MDALKATVPESVQKKIKTWKVKDMSILRGVSLKATSKIHRFKPTVSFEDALKWLCESDPATQNIDFTFIFDNGSAIMFQHGQFFEFENDDEDDDA